MGFLEVLTLIFITLKLTNFIDWSWWLVLSPSLFTLGLAIAVFGVYCISRKDQKR